MVLSPALGNPPQSADDSVRAWVRRVESLFQGSLRSASLAGLQPRGSRQPGVRAKLCCPKRRLLVPRADCKARESRFAIGASSADACRPFARRNPGDLLVEVGQFGCRGTVGECRGELDARRCYVLENGR